VTPTRAPFPDAHAGAVGRRPRLVPGLARLPHDPPPAGEFQHDAVTILEGDGSLPGCRGLRAAGSSGHRQGQRRSAAADRCVQSRAPGGGDPRQRGPAHRPTPHRAPDRCPVHVRYIAGLPEVNPRSIQRVRLGGPGPLTRRAHSSHPAVRDDHRHYPAMPPASTSHPCRQQQLRTVAASRGDARHACHAVLWDRKCRWALRRRACRSKAQHEGSGCATGVRQCQEGDSGSSLVSGAGPPVILSYSSR
jgi:hypothetical protein